MSLRRLVLFNLVIFLLGLTALYSYASTSAAAQPARPYAPQPAARAGEATHLSYISYTKNGGGETSTLTHPLGSDRRTLQPAVTHALVSQSDSPNLPNSSLWVIRKLNKLLCSCLPIA